VVLGAAMTLFPALLGYLGAHIDRLRIRCPAARSSQVPAGCAGAGSCSGTRSARTAGMPGWSTRAGRPTRDDGDPRSREIGRAAHPRSLGPRA
jgi:hypothetical protein